MPSPIVWSPADWVYTHIPLAGENEEIVEMESMVAACQAHVDTVTEADITALQAVLHVAHMLMSMQGADGRWPATFNARTGEELAKGRSLAPVGLLRRLDALQDACEFDAVCDFAEAGRSQT